MPVISQGTIINLVSCRKQPIRHWLRWWQLPALLCVCFMSCRPALIVLTPNVCLQSYVLNIFVIKNSYLVCNSNWTFFRESASPNLSGTLILVESWLSYMIAMHFGCVLILPRLRLKAGKRFRKALLSVYISIFRCLYYFVVEFCIYCTMKR